MGNSNSKGFCAQQDGAIYMVCDYFDVNENHPIPLFER
jgi:hypothetical protein